VSLIPFEHEIVGCDDCGTSDDLLIISADLGEGAFLAILCKQCWHRRQYRASLLKRKAAR